MLLVPWGSPAAPPEPHFGNHDTRVLLDAFGETSGQAAEVILDNFWVIKHDAPLVSAESAVRVSFPATDRAFTGQISASGVQMAFQASDELVDAGGTRNVRGLCRASCSTFEPACGVNCHRRWRRRR
jgi:hypothetical protein